MTEADIEIIPERANELYPGVKPRIISDNGPISSPRNARPDFTVIPSMERQNRKLAQVTQRGVHPGHDVVARRCGISLRSRRA
jgi:hypothetical protein